MRWADAMSRTVAAVLPWPRRRDRRQAIDNARREHERSAATAAQAKVVERDIRWLHQQNRWAPKIADALGIDRGEGK